MTDGSIRRLLRHMGRVAAPLKMGLVPMLSALPSSAARHDDPPDSSVTVRVSSRIACRARTQRGQALTEFLGAAVALVPLFLLIPLIAKYQDIAHTTQLATRYVAFDSFARNDSVGTAKSESQLADEIRRRFFSNADAPIKTDDVAGNFLAHRNLFWRGPSNAALIRDFGNDVSVGFGAGNGASHDAAFSAGSDGLPFVLHNQLGLRARGVYTANVSVVLANLPAGLKFFEPFDRINLNVGRSTSVAIDPWAARDPAQVEAKVSGHPDLFLTGPLAALTPAVDTAVHAIDAPAGLSGPLLGQLDFWRDVVPNDRLKTEH